MKSMDCKSSDTTDIFEAYAMNNTDLSWIPA